MQNLHVILYLHLCPYQAQVSFSYLHIFSRTQAGGLCWATTTSLVCGR
jgi:hypothetical protein